MRYIFATRLAVVIASSLTCFAADATPPELKSLQFTPVTIDTSAGPAEVTLSFSIADGSSPVTYFEAAFVDSSGTFSQSVTAKFPRTPSATGSAKVTFPRFSNAGSWTLTRVFLSDADGNTSLANHEELLRRGFPTKLEVVSAQDTTPPKLTSLEFSPAEIDTGTGPVDVSVNYTATDDLAGVNYVELGFVSPSGATRRGGSVKFEPVRSVTKSMNITFPRLSEAGQWTLSTVFLADAAGNTVALDAEALIRGGYRTNLEVKSASDTTPPTLTGVHFTPDVIDTSRGPVTVNVDITAADDLSGVNYVELSFLSPTGTFRQSGSAKFEPAGTVSKSIPITFPTNSQPGQWVLNMVFLSDAAGNTLVLDAEGILGSGLQSKLGVK